MPSALLLPGCSSSLGRKRRDAPCRLGPGTWGSPCLHSLINTHLSHLHPGSSALVQVRCSGGGRVLYHQLPSYFLMLFQQCTSRRHSNTEKQEQCLPSPVGAQTVSMFFQSKYQYCCFFKSTGAHRFLQHNSCSLRAPQHPCREWRRLGFLEAPSARLVSHQGEQIVFFLLSFFFFNFIYLFIYLGLRWVFVAARSLSLVVASGGYSSLRCVGFSLQWLLLLQSAGSRCAGFGSCGT